jgi:hypothetical protein
MRRLRQRGQQLGHRMSLVKLVATATMYDSNAVDAALAQTIFRATDD